MQHFGVCPAYLKGGGSQKDAHPGLRKFEALGAVGETQRLLTLPQPAQGQHDKLTRAGCAPRLPAAQSPQTWEAAAVVQILQRTEHCRVLCVPLLPDRRTVGQSGQPCDALLLQGHGAGSG